MAHKRRHFIFWPWAAAAAGGHTPSWSQSQASPVVLVLGDSLSAEYGLPRGSGWVALLAQRLAARPRPWQVVNASISGDTTSGGRQRLPALLAQHKPQLVVIELGGNDALRGLSLAHTRDNLRAMAEAARTARARVLLLGMQVPPNYGAQYTRDFANTFAEVARSTQSQLVPFLLQGLVEEADSLKWFQSDRIHPNQAAQPRILDNVWPTLSRLLT